MRSVRWLLCDGREDKSHNIFKARNKIEVSLRSTYFKIRVTRLNKKGVNISLVCNDLSEGELMQKLQEISTILTNASYMNDIEDDEVSQETAEISVASPASPTGTTGPSDPTPESVSTALLKPSDAPNH
jgi:hypothetical protein